MQTRHEIRKKEGSVKSEYIHTPLLIGTGVYEGKHQQDFTACRKAKLEIVISIPGSEIPVRIRDVEFYNVHQKMTDVLLGRPFLLALVFYLDSHLMEIASNINGKSINELRSSKMLYTEMIWHHDDEEDPINFSEDLNAAFGKDDKEDIIDAYDVILNSWTWAFVRKRSVHNRTRKVNWTLGNQPSIFDIRLGPEKAVKVPPLKSKPVDGAKPFRYSQKKI